MTQRLKVSEIRKLNVPDRIQDLIGGKHAYVITGGKGVGAERTRSGFYTMRDSGRINHGRIPKYAYSEGSDYANLSYKIKPAERREMGRKIKEEANDEIDLDAETEDREVATAIEGLEQFASGEGVESATTELENMRSQEANEAPTPEQIQARADERARQEKAEADARKEETENQRKEALAKKEAEIKERSDAIIEEIYGPYGKLKDEYKMNVKAETFDFEDKEVDKFLNWSSFSKEFSKWSGIFKNFYDHLMKMLNYGSSSITNALTSITITPVMKHMFDANKDIEKVFSNAGIRDIDKWARDHNGTTQYRLLRNKVADMTSGMQEGFGEVKGIFAEAALATMVAQGIGPDGKPKQWTDAEKKLYLRQVKSGDADGFMDQMEFNTEATKRLGKKLSDKANELRLQCQADPKNRKLRAKYMMYYRASLGLSEGKKTVRTALESDEFLMAVGKTAMDADIPIEQVRQSLKLARKAVGVTKSTEKVEEYIQEQSKNREFTNGRKDDSFEGILSVTEIGNPKVDTPKDTVEPKKEPRPIPNPTGVPVGAKKSLRRLKITDLR